MAAQLKIIQHGFVYYSLLQFLKQFWPKYLKLGKWSNNSTLSRSRFFLNDFVVAQIPIDVDHL